MIRTFVAILLFSLVGVSDAEEIASGFACTRSTSPEQLMKVLIDRGVIAKNPFIVGDSISYYSVRPRMTAFGFPLVTMAAYDEDSGLFTRGPGTSPGTRIAFIVQASVFQVAEGMRARKLAPSQATATEYPQLKVEGYNSMYQEPLPKEADLRFAYTQILCLPR